MANFFPPKPIYPKNYDDDSTLFLVYNTSETITTQNNNPWSDEISIRPVSSDRPEVWADNGFATIEGELFYYDDVEKNEPQGSGLIIGKILVDEEGSITSIPVQEGGSGYYFPQIKILGTGYGAKIEAVVQDGSIISFNIIQGGKGYKPSTTSLSFEGKVIKFKRCSRNLGGSQTKFNYAGSEVRGFVIAEHHNQIADTIISIENFIGSNFDIDKKTLDWRIRHLQNLPIIFDDYNCPDVSFSFYVVSEDPATGITISYDVVINGSYNSYTLDFGDGQTTNTSTSGTHVYATSSSIDPLVTVTTDRCTIVQTPIERNIASEPNEPTVAPGFSINIPIIPNIPPFVFPSIPIPPTPQIPPIVFPCLDVGPIGPINVPSIIIIDPPVPSVISFNPLPQIPSIISFTTPTIPTLISITTPNIPTLINIPSPNIPTLISITTPVIPTLISISSPNIPTLISISSPNIPTLISITTPNIPTLISITTPNIPTLISITTPNIPTLISITTPNIPTLISITTPNIPTLISITTPNIPTLINFGADPIIPTLINFGADPIIPTLINFGADPIIPTLINFGADPVIPTLINFGADPVIPTLITFGADPVIPTLITFGAAPFIPSLIQWETYTGPTEFWISWEDATLTDWWFQWNDRFWISWEDATTTEWWMQWNDYFWISWQDATTTDWWIEWSSHMRISWEDPPGVSIIWDGAPTLSCVVTVECPTGGAGMAAQSTEFDEEGNLIELNMGNIGIPSEIKVIFPEEMPNIKVIHDLPAIIRVVSPDMPSEIKIVSDYILPSEIKVIADGIPTIIEILSNNIPSSIELDVSNLPKSIPLEVPEQFPSVKLDVSDLPEKIQVVGIPSTIELTGAPSEIKLVLPEKPEIELVYKGAPIDVKVNLDVSRLTGGDDKSQCVAIVPCGNQ